MPATQRQNEKRGESFRWVFRGLGGDGRIGGVSQKGRVMEQQQSSAGTSI